MISLEEKLWELIELDMQLYKDAKKSIEILKPCQKCGWCCSGNDILITIPEAIRVIAYTKFRISKVLTFDKSYNYIKFKRKGDYCIFYDNGFCKIHRVRPFQCMTYPVIFNPVVLEEDFEDKLVVIQYDDYIKFQCGSKVADRMTCIIESNKFHEIVSSRLTYLIKNYQLQITLLKIGLLDTFIKNMVRKYPLERWFKECCRDENH